MGLSSYLQPGFGASKRTRVELIRASMIGTLGVGGGMTMGMGGSMIGKGRLKTGN